MKKKILLTKDLGPCCCQWLQARLQLSRASVSLEVGRDSADLCCSGLIATASIVDSVGETCALFNHGVFLGKHPSFSSNSDMESLDFMDFICPGKISADRDAQAYRHSYGGRTEDMMR
jgi:hypothetical protein